MFAISFDRFIHRLVTVVNKFLFGFHRYKNLSPLADERLMKIDVIIPLIKKDLLVAPSCINAVRTNCLNPIDRIYIIAPDIIEIRTFCIENDLLFLNEEDISPVPKSVLATKVVSDRVGWILQQLIKLNADNIKGINKYFLLLDADTVLNRKQFFISDKRYILKHSDEFHYLYRKTNKKLLSYSKFYPPSYISHHQLIDSEILGKLKLHIEAVSGFQKWYEVIIKEAISNYCYFSEYELYAMFLLKYTNENVVSQYWFNDNKKIQHISDISTIVIDEKYLSASYHNYIRN